MIDYHISMVIRFEEKGKIQIVVRGITIGFFFLYEIRKIQTMKTSFGFILDSRLSAWPGKKINPFSREKIKG